MDNIISVFAKNSGGLFSGAQGIIGIVLVLAGIGMIYTAVKLMQGYELLPQKETIPKEDTYVPSQAKVIRMQGTEMPALNGGAPTVLKECVIEYTVDGEAFQQIIPDDDYEKEQMLDIKYNPENPKEYYLDNGIIIPEASEEEEEEKLKKSPVTNAILILAGMIIVLGIVLVVDKII